MITNAPSNDILRIQDFAKKHIEEYNERYSRNPDSTFMCNCAEDVNFKTTLLISDIVCERNLALVTHIGKVVGLDRIDIVCYQVAHAFWNDFVKNGNLWTYSKIQQEYKEFASVNEEIKNE